MEDNNQSLLVSEVPRNLDTKSKIMGFELIDVLMMFMNLSIQNIFFGDTQLKIVMVYGTTAALGVFLFAFKRGKPDQFLQHYFQHLAMPSQFHGNAPDMKYRKFKGGVK